MSRINSELEKLIGGKTDPTEVAEIVARYVQKRARQRDTAARRREYINSIINDSKTLSMQQMDALVWEYTMSNASMTFQVWLGMEHPELFETATNEVPAQWGDRISDHH